VLLSSAGATAAITEVAKEVLGSAAPVVTDCERGGSNDAEIGGGRGKSRPRKTPKHSVPNTITNTEPERGGGPGLFFLISQRLLRPPMMAAWNAAGQNARRAAVV